MQGSRDSARPGSQGRGSESLDVYSPTRDSRVNPSTSGSHLAIPRCSHTWMHSRYLYAIPSCTSMTARSGPWPARHAWRCRAAKHVAVAREVWHVSSRAADSCRAARLIVTGAPDPFCSCDAAWPCDAGGPAAPFGNAPPECRLPPGLPEGGRLGLPPGLGAGRVLLGY